MATSNVIAQSVAIVSLPILSRLFTPADFGLLAIFLAILRVTTALCTIRYDWSVPNAQSKLEAAHLLQLFTVFLFVTSIVGGISVFLLEGWIIQYMGEQVPAWTVRILPVAIFGTSMTVALQAWYVHSGDLTQTGRARIAQSFSTNGLNVISGFAGFSGSALVLSYVVGLWVNFLWMAYTAKSFFINTRETTYAALSTVARKFGTEAFFSTLGALLSACSFSTVPLLIAAFYGAGAAGKYSLILTAFIAPLGIISAALGNSFWSEASARVKTDKQDMERFYFKTMKRLLFFCTMLMPIYVGVSFFAEFIFGPEKWEGLGNYLIAITPMVFANLVFSTTNHLIVYRKQNWQFYSDVVTLLGVILSIFLCANAGYSPPIAIFASGLAFLLGYLLRVAAHMVANRRYNPA